MSEPPIYRIAVPNPFVEGRTCVYVIAADPITMIDSGIATDRAFQELQTGLQEHGLKADDIKRVVLTHKHIDHIGNAWRFQQLSGAEILIHEREQHAVEDVDPTGERHAAAVSRKEDDWDVPDDARLPSTAKPGYEWLIEPVHARTFVDGERLPLGDSHLEVIHTPGHTMGSCCLKFGRFLFSGDHVLPDISPNVGGGDMQNLDLLRHYLASLARVRDLTQADDLEVLPGHGDPMHAVADRCTELIKHHEERLAAVLKILRLQGRRTVYEIACELFGHMEGFHVVLGCAEANAHLEYLVEHERVAQDMGKYSLFE